MLASSVLPARSTRRSTIPARPTRHAVLPSLLALCCAACSGDGTPGLGAEGAGSTAGSNTGTSAGTGGVGGDTGGTHGTTANTADGTNGQTAGMGADAGPPAKSLPVTTDPGTDPWEPVPRDQVAEVCGLDPDLLDAADQQLNLRWGVVRYGRLCHEFYPGSNTKDSTVHVFSATKTHAAVVAGAVMYQTRDLPEAGPRTGPLDEFDRVDKWMDVGSTSFDIHADATLAHVMAMIAYSDDLSYGAKAHSYDATGTREINAMSDILNAAIAQDTSLLGKDLEEFTQRHVYGPLGMQNSTWSDGASDKDFSMSWVTSVRDMLRMGLLINNGGVWNGARLLTPEYLYNMTHPAFEDGNTGYGYLTWLNGADHRPPVVGQFLMNPLPADGCAPLALHNSYPHGISKAPDCGYTTSGLPCDQQYDVGTWSAQGLNGNYIYGQRGLDLVMVIQEYGTLNSHSQLWDAVRPALLAEEPMFKGDNDGFCAAYSTNDYAPDLQLWEGGL